MRPRQLLDSFSIAGDRPLWSYHHTGTLPRLISFICHSYENTRGVGVFFPFRNALRGHTEKHPLFIQVLSFHTLVHSFARDKNSTLFFSGASALFRKNTRGWGIPSTPRGAKYKPGDASGLLVDVVLRFQPLQQRLEKRFRRIGRRADRHGHFFGGRREIARVRRNSRERQMTNPVVPILLRNSSPWPRGFATWFPSFQSGPRFESKSLPTSARLPSCNYCPGTIAPPRRNPPR